MDLTFSAIVVFIALLVCVSATYNAYILRGGKLAMSEVFIALGMISLALSQVALHYFPDLRFSSLSASEFLYLAGFVLFLFASIKLRSSIK